MKLANNVCPVCKPVHTRLLICFERLPSPLHTLPDICVHSSGTVAILLLLKHSFSTQPLEHTVALEPSFFSDRRQV